MNEIIRMKKIDYINIFPSVENYEYNQCIVLLRDEKNRKYLMYSEKLSNTVSLDMIKKGINTNLFMINEPNVYNMNFELYPDKDGIVFKIFSLDEELPKLMTKKEIEKELGYKITIKEE